LIRFTEITWILRRCAESVEMTIAISNLPPAQDPLALADVGDA
jgi:hypothetical protein